MTRARIVPPATHLGSHGSLVDSAIARLEKERTVPRIWQRDHTVWKPHPAEIVNRLGWLTVTHLMREQAPAMQSFARTVAAGGFRDAILLGMGGSSLGAEVLGQTFGAAPGHLKLHVLDSTVPGAIEAVSGAIDHARALFVLSSKSGTTTEPLALYHYFRSRLERIVGVEEAGHHFVAITDAATPLVGLAQSENFLRVFANPPYIGGRYSVLSYFGLVPAALSGVDITSLLDSADKMREMSEPGAPVSSNPAAWLGATMGALAQQGKDKLTLLTSPSIGSFGLWVEQLVAESTGKEGKGIVPVVNEPVAAAGSYRADRLFVYLRLDSDDNAGTDRAIGDVAAQGHPVVVLDIGRKSDMGGEFFRWELATAVAGAVLGIHPFDQPDVQSAKDMTGRLLKDYRATGKLPEIDDPGKPAGLLARTEQGDYLAIMAYLRQTPEMDAAFAGMRARVAERRGIATTLGYGPRFLHSTGQIHKGGKNSGLFLQITARHRADIPVPGEPYSFGVLCDAQAAGDFLALRAAGRRAVRVHLPEADPTLVAALANELA